MTRVSVGNSRPWHRRGLQLRLLTSAYTYTLAVTLTFNSTCLKLKPKTSQTMFQFSRRAIGVSNQNLHQKLVTLSCSLNRLKIHVIEYRQVSWEGRELLTVVRKSTERQKPWRKHPVSTYLHEFCPNVATCWANTRASCATQQYSTIVGDILDLGNEILNSALSPSDVFVSFLMCSLCTAPLTVCFFFHISVNIQYSWFACTSCLLMSFYCLFCDSRYYDDDSRHWCSHSYSRKITTSGTRIWCQWGPMQRSGREPGERSEQPSGCHHSSDNARHANYHILLVRRSSCHSSGATKNRSSREGLASCFDDALPVLQEQRAHTQSLAHTHTE